MFGKNEIVGKKYFKDVNLDQLFVTSMFMTLQGEGPFRGEPAFFIRLAKCNLNCSFCDTFFDDGDWLTFDQIEEKIEDAIDAFYENLKMDRPEWTKHQTNYGYIQKKKMVLVITGGEPMLQENLGPFLDVMENIFQQTQIETNGTQNTLIPKSTVLVCSPKCSEKQGKALKYLEPRSEVLERADCLKFVMCSDSESPYSNIPEWAHLWAEHTNKPVYVSPMNIYNTLPQKSKNQRAKNNDISLEERSTIDEVISFWEPGLLNMSENQKNHEYAAQFCVKHGYVLNLQIHLYASLP
jgi:organic radical activating enzyme